MSTLEVLKQRIQESEPFADLFYRPEFKQAVRKTEEAITKSWKTAQTTEEREAAFHTLQGLTRFVQTFKALADDGRIAADLLVKKIERDRKY